MSTNPFLKATEAFSSRTMKHPCVRTVDSVIRSSQEVSCGLPDGRWVPARSEGLSSWRHRVYAAWLVFTGRADALIWEQQ